jgi:type IV pilus assembly protein PilA
MSGTLRSRIASEDGFTLAELLVVILVMGILAAMAIPTFLAQRSKGYDASAKTDARNMYSHVESCFTTELTYVNCDTSAELNPTGAPSGLAWGSAAGQVEVLSSPAATSNSYTVVAHSKSTYNFTLAKAASGLISRTCSNPGKGACATNGSW